MSLKIFEYSGPLFRAEKDKGSNILTNANTHYNKNISHHFFTTVKSEVNAYSKYGTSYVKTWQTAEPLYLLDIMDLATRRELEKTINANKLQFAFPIMNNVVYRVSEEESVPIDRAILKAICSLTHNGRPLDGYYMKRMENTSGRYGKFHSEIGLCRRAFSKVMLERVDKKVNPQQMKRESKSQSRRTRRRNNNNNNVRNGLSMPNITRFLSPIKAQRTPIQNRNITRNNNNNNSSLFIKKRILTNENYESP